MAFLLCTSCFLPMRCAPIGWWNWITQGRSHQTLFAKRKVAGAWRLAKNLPFNFINIFSLAGLKIKAQICELFAKCIFAKRVRHSKFAQFLRQKSFSSMHAKKWGKNVDEIEPPRRQGRIYSIFNHMFKVAQTGTDDKQWIRSYQLVSLKNQIPYFFNVVNVGLTQRLLS